MKIIIIKYKAEAVGVALGAIAGWAYWYFVGCSTGSCAITSSPVNSTLYGAFMGAILGNMFKKSEKQDKKNEAK
ncbi:MAG: hypothetical protein JNJ40_16245 [Bacteroidia bacterium]|nr:hypothetical protein [Bacteroidia bacterium]